MVYVSAYYGGGWWGGVGLASEGLSQGVCPASQLSTQMMTSPAWVESVGSLAVSSYRCPVRPGPSPGEELILVQQLTAQHSSPSH